MKASSDLFSAFTRIRTRTRLVLFVLLAAVPVYLLIIFNATEQRVEAKTQAREGLVRLTQLAAERQKEWVGEARQFLRLLAGFPSVRAGDFNRCNDVLGGLVTYLGERYQNFGVVNLRGDIVCSGLQMRGRAKANISDRPHFQQVLKTAQFTAGQYRIGRISGKPGIDFFYPVQDDNNRVVAVVFASLDLGQFNQVIRSTPLPPNAVLTITDRDETIIARHPDPESSMGRPFSDDSDVRARLVHGDGVSEFVGKDGVRLVEAFTRLGNVADPILLVSITIPTRSIDAPIDRLLLQNLVSITIATALLIEVAWLSAEPLVLRRIRVLLDTTYRLKKGDLSARSGLVYGSEELSQLGQAVDELADTLQINDRMRQQAENALQRSMVELRQRNREVTLVSEMVGMLESCSTADEAYSVFQRFGPQLFPTLDGEVYQFQASRDFLEATTAWGDRPLEVKNFPPEDCWALRRGIVHRVDEAGSSFTCNHVVTNPFVPYICVPMRAHGETLGLLHLQSQCNAGGAVTAEMDMRIDLAITVSDHLCLALANLRLRETLRFQAIRDPLTGLHNRRLLEEHLGLEIAKAQRAQAQLAVVMIDVDHFKRFNDTFGHDGGDLVLQAVARPLQEHVRKSDLACRYGGEEFMLVVGNSVAEATLRRCEELRQKVRRLSVIRNKEQLGMISISIGVAMYPEHGATTEELIYAADIALYKAKGAGRDAVVMTGTG